MSLASSGASVLELWSMLFAGLGHQLCKFRGVSLGILGRGFGVFWTRFKTKEDAARFKTNGDASSASWQIASQRLRVLCLNIGTY